MLILLWTPPQKPELLTFWIKDSNNLVLLKENPDSPVVKFDTNQPPQPQVRPKNGRPTTSSIQRGKRGQGRGNH